MNPVTVIAVGDTETGVIEGLAQQSGRLVIVRRCPELAELLAVSQNGLAQVALIAGFAEELTATLVDRLTAVGVSVVAVADSPEAAGRLRGIGAMPVAAHVGEDALIEAVCAAVEGRRHRSPSGYAVPVADAGFPQIVAPRVEKGGTNPPSASPALENVPTEHTSSDQAKKQRNAAPTKSGLPGADADAGGEATGDAPEAERATAPSGHKSLRRAENVSNDDVAQTRVPPPTRSAGWSVKIASSLRPGISRKQRRAGTSRKSTANNAALSADPASGAGPDPREERRGRIVAVWGPTGSPGRTMLAMNLAAEEAAAGRKVMLIDADSYGASIAASLGLLDESASFAQACRAADQGVLTLAALKKISSELVFAGGTFSLLTGLTRADRWPELRAAAVERVLRMAQELAELVVVDCGFAVESDEELSYDTVAPRRNAATLTVLLHADVIYAIGNSDPVGIPRLIRGLGDITQLCPDTPVRVVANKVRRKAVGGSPEKALAQAWDRFGPGQVITHFLPWDPELTDKALLEGRLLLEIAPTSPLRKAIRDITCAADQRKSKVAVAKATAKL